MSETKHTPGPWAIGDLDRNGQRIVRSQHTEICTCWHHCVRSIETEMEANAKLIAAAPDLLAACEAALPKLSEADDYARNLIEAAIAKLSEVGSV